MRRLGMQPRGETDRWYGVHLQWWSTAAQRSQAMTARVVLLNGAGSAGKSTIARELQSITREPFLHVPMDAFLEMLPQQFIRHCPMV